MADAASANYTLLVSRERLANAIRESLRLQVGRGRRYTVKDFHRATGVPARMIESAMCEVGSPDWRPLKAEELLSIAAFLGPDFTNEWLHFAGQGAFDLPDDEPSPGDLAIEGAEDSAAVVKAAMDGQFCEKERADLRVIGARKIRRGQQLVALASAA